METENSFNLSAVSLFCSSGIGDIALETTGVKVLVANELIPERAELYKHNFPQSTLFCGDIWSLNEKLINETKKKLEGNDLDILFATPPCQGMSKNGQGKLLNAIRKGLKPKFDTRNRLIIPCLDIAVALQPRILVMENVPEMENTFILENDNPDSVISILDYISKKLGKEYVGSWEVVEFADYVVPQRRQRLITVFSRDKFVIDYIEKFNTALPERTHSKTFENGKSLWRTVRDTISNLPKLDAKSLETSNDPSIPFHRVPLLDQDKYFWVSNTPPEKGAFDNQCVNPKCRFQYNTNHSAFRGKDGINRTRKDTPLYCMKCGEILPRPWVRNGEEIRLMRGYTSAYKRMNWDLPASTLTRNLSYACSDNKLHPEQNRVLSLYEAMLLHTITDFNYEWKRADGKKVSDKLIKESIGESIPPLGLKFIFQHLIKLVTHEQKVMDKRYAPSKQLCLL